MKAVIMAGGEGSRLRPLTCTAPKPMAKILGKPIIEYVFDNLISGGVTHAAVTLGYLPHVIENSYENGYKTLKLDFIREDEPLGTAGSVKNAASGFDEPFVVISADAMCDFDIEKIMLYHKASGAMVTIVATDVDDPREFGVLKVGEENRVYGFLEKPSWSQAISSLANTGVYIINPECLKLIPNGKKYDFASDLFPMMLERDMPIRCYHTDGYWCDVGNTSTYLRCQRDAFDGKFRAPAGCCASGIYVKDKLPVGDYGIVPPVYIGSDVEIADGAVIGPYAVIDDNCYIGENSKVRRSTVLENSSLASDTSLTGALVCSGAALKKGAAMFEGSVAGSGCVIGESASVKPNVLIWPGKIIGPGASISDNVKYGNLRADFIGENGVIGKDGAVINAETCVKLGYAVSSSKNGKRVGVGHDGSKKAFVMSLALSAGLADGGGAVWDFGECFEAELNFLVNFCGLDSGMFVSDSEKSCISLCAENGLSPDRAFEREIESSMSRCEFRQADEKSIREISDMSGIKLLYVQELMKQLGGNYNGFSAAISCKNEKIADVLGGCFSRFGISGKSETVFNIDYSGMSVDANTEKGRINSDRLLAICCYDEFRKGRDVAVPYSAPDYINSLAESCGRRVMRYLSAPADNSDASARKLAAKQIFVRDALFMCAKLVSVMNERCMTLDMLSAELPEKYIEKKTFTVNFPASRLSAVIGADKDEKTECREGIRVLREEGSLLLVPERGGGRINVCAEADTMEAAQELCADIEEIINSISD